MRILRLDHYVLTVTSIKAGTEQQAHSMLPQQIHPLSSHLDLHALHVNPQATCEWYSRVLGMQQHDFGPGKTALHFGDQTKINLHLVGHEPLPKAGAPTPGSSDVCLVTDASIETAKAHVESQGVQVLEGPVKRTGALGAMTSIYFRDPDLNLVEVSSYGKPESS